MKKIVFLASGPSANGQENGITAFDLYGCWTFQNSKDGQRLEKRIFQSCPEADKTLFRKSSKIRFLAYNKCEFQAVIQDAICPIIYKTVEGTWTYSDKSGILEMYYPKNFQAEFWQKVKEDYPELEIPNPRPYMRFKIVNLDESGLLVQIVRLPRREVFFPLWQNLKTFLPFFTDKSPMPEVLACTRSL